MEFINQLPAFSLVFVRILSMFMIVPVFSMRGVPVQFRVGTAFFMAIIVYSGLSIGADYIPVGGEYVFLILKEVLIGLMLGFMTALFFAALQIAGQFIDVQMGFFLANVMDPQTGSQIPVIGFLKYYLGLLIFLVMDIHLIVIQAYLDSFTVIPLGHLFMQGNYAQYVVDAFIHMFIIAIKISAPVTFCLVLTNVALGITARTVPQMNVFVIGMPLKIALGLLLIYISLPTFLLMLDLLFDEMIESVYIMIHIIANSGS